MTDSPLEAGMGRNILYKNRDRDGVREFLPDGDKDGHLFFNAEFPSDIHITTSYYV